jgi:hypothetical protein
MTNEWPSLLAPGDKIVSIITFERRFQLNVRQEAPGQARKCQESAHLMVLFSTRTVHSVKAGKVLECFRIP